MTHLSVRAAALAAATCLTLAGAADVVHAQCSTCPTPTVAFAPIVAPAPVVVVAPRVGLFDRWRMRRWGVTAPVVAVAPVAQPVTVGFAPTAQPVTVGFAPAPAPFVTAFAPLQRPVVQTTFMPIAPTTVFRPAVITPVVSAPPCTTCAFAPEPCSACATTAAFASTPCDACAAASPCSSCSACSAGTVVEQAGFTAAAPSSGCSSCDAAAAASSGSSSDPMTPQPQIDPNVGVPMSSGYAPASGPVFPGPAADAGATNGFYAPQLLPPTSNNSANNSNRPTVDVHTAVYRRPVGAASVSTTTAPVQRAVDAGGWDSVPATR